MCLPMSSGLMFFCVHGLHGLWQIRGRNTKYEKTIIFLLKYHCVLEETGHKKTTGSHVTICVMVPWLSLQCFIDLFIYFFYYQTLLATIALSFEFYCWLVLWEFIQSILNIFTPPTTSPRSTLPCLSTHHCVFCFLSSSLISAAHIFMNVWPSIRTWSTYQWHHF